MKTTKFENPNIVMAAGLRAINQMKVAVHFDDQVTMTKQAFKDECDINNIVAKFQSTGQLPHTRGEPQFGYVPDIDFKDALDMVQNAKREYGELPSHIRSKMSYDDYLEFISFSQDSPQEFEAMFNQDIDVDAEEFRSRSEGDSEVSEKGE